MLTFDDEEHIELADALGIAPVEKDGVATQAQRFIRAAWVLRDAKQHQKWKERRQQGAHAVASLEEAEALHETRLARIEEKLTELLRRTEPA